MVIEEHVVITAETGGDGETASLVRGYFTSQFNCFNKHLTGLGWGRILTWEDKRGSGD